MKKLILVGFILGISLFGISSSTFAEEFLRGICSTELQIHQNLNAPWPGQRYIKNGSYNRYTKGIVKEAHILQKHLNRLGFNAGHVDGIIGPLTRGAILRMQKFLGTKQDGYVGPLTRELLNNSCGGKENKKIIFKSNFEKGVYLGEETSDEGGIWWQRIKGSDVVGYSWPININGEGSLQLIVDYDKDIKKYISNRIEYMKDKNNNWTYALHQNIIKKQNEDTQDPYIIYTNGKEVEDLTIKYSIKLPKNTKELLGEDGWMALTEYKTMSDYRLAFYIYENRQGELYWYVHGDNVVDEPEEYEEFWYRENYKTNVPLGEWFDVKISWHRSKKKDGFVNIWVNNKKILEYKGKNKIKDPVNAIMIFTNYASGPMHQWIDNIEILR